MSTVKIKMKVVQWYDKNPNLIVFGIDIKIDDKPWAHCKDDNGPLFYKTKGEAKTAMLDLSERVSNFKLP